MSRYQKWTPRMHALFKTKRPAADWEKTCLRKQPTFRNSTTHGFSREFFFSLVASLNDGCILKLKEKAIFDLLDKWVTSAGFGMSRFS